MLRRRPFASALAAPYNRVMFRGSVSHEKRSVLDLVCAVPPMAATTGASRRSASPPVATRGSRTVSRNSRAVRSSGGSCLRVRRPSSASLSPTRVEQIEPAPDPAAKRRDGTLYDAVNETIGRTTSCVCCLHRAQRGKE